MAFQSTVVIATEAARFTVADSAVEGKSRVHIADGGSEVTFTLSPAKLAELEAAIRAYRRPTNIVPMKPSGDAA